jgi:predicted nucleic acid-binding protein
MTFFAMDTNVLIRLTVPGHPQRQSSFEAVERLAKSSFRPVIFPQLAYEFWAVVTRSVQANGLGYSADATVKLLRDIQQKVRVLHDGRTVYRSWLKLVERYQILGVNSHDLRIVAAMQSHGVKHLLTANAKDFRRYAEIQVMTPEEVVAGLHD